jgi:ABC-type Fe3+ transport system permease subunit
VSASTDPDLNKYIVDWVVGGASVPALVALYVLLNVQRVMRSLLSILHKIAELLDRIAQQSSGK